MTKGTNWICAGLIFMGSFAGGAIGPKLHACEEHFLNLFEAEYAQRSYNRCAGTVSRATEAADIIRKTLYRLLQKHPLERQT